MKFVAATHPEPAAIEGFRVFAESLPSITWIADADGNVEWYNGEFFRYTGLALPAALGASWLPIVHLDDRELLVREWTASLASGSDLDSVARLRGIDGTHRWFSLRARAFRGSNGTIAKWLGTSTDIHDRQIAADANAHVAGVLMKGYLSKKFPAVKGLKFDKLYEASNTAERLGGDWYDVFPLPDGRIAFSLGDVCGSGIDAAVKMAEAKQAIFVAACLHDPAPESVMQQANAVLFLNDHHVSITTAVYGIIDMETRTVTYASAGHHPPILVHADGKTEILPNHGFPLGVEEHMPPRIKTHEFTYGSGSMMVLYTDGLIEFGHDIFEGEALLLAASGKAIRSGAEYPAKFIARRVLGESPHNDDIAVLTISFEDV